ncbi:hypothetical protein GL267_003065 [Acidithiobacillus ferrianus]|uniref:Uncharacterized protein n=2 Tax=Acidithiobacillus ferrianus TaxID=2678518 RepID=A0A845U7F3_9PROT|nr:hypothetical protein [Acidithiobacillus ferrianus]NDU43346.1 hypothetical protein [Acidithiobacillus ferrianus]
MQEQNIMTREDAAKYGLRPILGFSSTKQLRQVYAEDAARNGKAKGGAQ